MYTQNLFGEGWKGRDKLWEVRITWKNNIKMGLNQNLRTWIAFIRTRKSPTRHWTFELYKGRKNLHHQRERKLLLRDKWWAESEMKPATQDQVHDDVLFVTAITHLVGRWQTSTEDLVEEPPSEALRRPRISLYVTAKWTGDVAVRIQRTVASAMTHYSVPLFP